MTLYGVDQTCSHGEPPGWCSICADAEYLAAFTAEHDAAAAEQDATDDADEFWTARPALAHIRDFARARRASPWAVLGVVLARVIIAVPRFVMLPPLVGGRASLNVFVALVGASGAGKGAAEAAASEAVDVIGGNSVDAVGAGSGEGLAHLFMRRVRQDIEQHSEAALLSVPEIDTLTALGDRRGATLLPELRKAWTGERLGFAYADPAKRLPVPAHGYRLCLITGVQPGRAASLLGDSDAGTPQRFLWLPATDPLAPDVAPDEPDPLACKLPIWQGEYPSGRVVLPVCRAARRVIDDQRLARLRGRAAALDGHALLARLKAAAALALLDGHAEVADADWELSRLLMAQSDRTRTAVIDTLRSAEAERNRQRGRADAERAAVAEEHQAASAAKRVARRLTARLGSDWTAGAGLRRELASRDRPYFTDAVERLLAAGVIEAEQTAHGHRYRLVGGAS